MLDLIKYLLVGSLVISLMLFVLCLLTILLIMYPWITALILFLGTSSILGKLIIEAYKIKN